MFKAIKLVIKIDLMPRDLLFPWLVSLICVAGTSMALEPLELLTGERKTSLNPHFFLENYFKLKSEINFFNFHFQIFVDC